jgi:predicted phage-related endonuclease
MPDASHQTISASQSPALFDASPYVTRWMLWQHIAKGEPLPQPDHNRIPWGQRLQPLVLAVASDELKLEVRPNAADDYVRRGLIGCTRDAEIFCPDRGPGALETKCVFDYGVWMREWEGGKRPPRHYEIQLQHQMMVGDGEKPFGWGILAAWCCGDMHYFERKPIPELWAEIDRRVAQFFDDVKSGREPEPFGDPVEVSMLATVFPTVEGNVLDYRAEPDALAVAEKARMVEYHAKEVAGNKRVEKSLKAQLQAIAKDHDAILLPNGITVKLRRQSRKAFSVAETTFTVVSVHVPDDLPDDLPEGEIGY